MAFSPQNPRSLPTEASSLPHLAIFLVLNTCFTDPFLLQAKWNAAQKGGRFRD